MDIYSGDAFYESFFPMLLEFSSPGNGLRLKVKLNNMFGIVRTLKYAPLD